MQGSKEEKLFFLKEQINTFKQSLRNPASFDRNILLSSTPKKDHIRMWGETLEKIFILENRYDEINSISTIIGLELKEMGLQKVIVYSQRVLPFKYKDASKMHKKSTLLDDMRTIRHTQYVGTVKSDEQITKENKRVIESYTDTIITLEKFVEKLHTKEFLGKLDDDAIHLVDEFIINATGFNKLLNNMYDEREKVLTEKQHLLAHAFAQYNKSFAFNMYLKYIRDFEDMTPKQAVRILKGRITKVEPMYDPEDMIHARAAGFSGFQCDECGSWRLDERYHTDMAKNMMFCYACKTWGSLKKEELLEKIV